MADVCEHGWLRRKCEICELRTENEELLAALWEIRMTAELASVDEPVWLLPNRIIFIAEAAMGADRQRAQELAAERRRRIASGAGG